jgi:hypothetical protein
LFAWTGFAISATRQGVQSSTSTRTVLTFEPTSLHSSLIPEVFVADGRVNLPNSPFETIAIADVVDRLGLENHFSFHDYDDDGRSIRHYAGDATIEGDLEP